MKKSISLIGMAGAGKSSIGKKLADHLGFSFIDSDLLIETEHQESLQRVLDKFGKENFLKIEEKIKNFGDYLYSKFEKSDPDQSKFIESYLTTTLIVITGPLAIIGPFFDVVESNLELLLIKTALDCFLVMFITSSGGKGAVYSGVSILIYQGFFTLCALLINTNIDQVVSDSIAGIGGVLLIGVGINLLGLKKIPVGNYMLSLFVPFILTL